ncbi:hypothetical protein F5X97DRAFT_310025, partial [Nemania serpens]
MTRAEARLEREKAAEKAAKERRVRGLHSLRRRFRFRQVLDILYARPRTSLSGWTLIDGKLRYPKFLPNKARQRDKRVADRRRAQRRRRRRRPNVDLKYASQFWQLVELDTTQPQRRRDRFGEYLPPMLRSGSSTSIEDGKPAGSITSRTESTRLSWVLSEIFHLEEEKRLKEERLANSDGADEPAEDSDVANASSRSYLSS